MSENNGAIGAKDERFVHWKDLRVLSQKVVNLADLEAT